MTMLGHATESGLPNLGHRVALLTDPRAYDDAPADVVATETALSWVFLTRQCAYKLKKPVDSGAVGPDSLEERWRRSDEDVRLNRRLAPDVYLGVVPVAETPGRLVAVGGRGVPIDWLVKMRRLPADRMLDQSIRAGGPTARELRFVTRLLARFFKAEVPIAMPPMEYRRRLADTITASRRVLANPAARHSVRSVETVTAALRKFIMGQPSLFERRVRRGCIREGHGDLRAANVFLGPNAAVIGCLDHERDMRVLDFADELSLLAIECEVLGNPQPGRTILEACCDKLGDEPEPELIAFYKARRALMSARSAIRRRGDRIAGGNGCSQMAPDTWLALATRYARQIG